MKFKNSRVEIFIGCLCTDQFSTEKKPRTVAIHILQESLKLFQHFSDPQQVTKLLNKNSSKKTFSRGVKNSWDGNSVNVCKSGTV